VYDTHGRTTSNPAQPQFGVDNVLSITIRSRVLAPVSTFLSIAKNRMQHHTPHLPRWLKGRRDRHTRIGHQVQQTRNLWVHHRVSNRNIRGVAHAQHNTRERQIHVTLLKLLRTERVAFGTTTAANPAAVTTRATWRLRIFVHHRSCANLGRWLEPHRRSGARWDALERWAPKVDANISRVRHLVCE